MAVNLPAFSYQTKQNIISKLDELAPSPTVPPSALHNIPFARLRRREEPTSSMVFPVTPPRMCIKSRQNPISRYLHKTASITSLDSLTKLG